MKDINNSLAELEDNLKQMSSAREQIELISTKADALTEAYTENIECIKEVTTTFGTIGSTFSNNINSQIQKLELSVTEIKNISTDSTHLIKDQVDKVLPVFKQTLEEVKLYIDDLSKDVDSKRDKMIDTFLKDNQAFYTESRDKVIDFASQTTASFKIIGDDICNKAEEIKKLDFTKEIKSLNKTQELLSSTFTELSKRVDDNSEKFKDLGGQVKGVEKSLQSNKQDFDNTIKQLEINNKELITSLKKANQIQFIVIIILILVSIGVVVLK